ncbi:MAG: alpha/beta fold hydrolase [Acidimicrobiales bacterium]|jgi:carboxylesterase
MTTAIMPGCEPYSFASGPFGVLVLHGFTGNPVSMRPLAEACAKGGFSVELPRLPGHGTSVEDLMTTGWADWSQTALASFDDLASRCSKVAVVGLSMGGGLAALIAESRPEVVGCVFINPWISPLNPELLDGLDQFIAAGVVSYDSVGSDIKKEDTSEAAYEATPLAQVKSACDGLTVVRENLGKITAPSLLITSRIDHTVNWERGEAITESSSGPVEQIWLEDSYHVATLDNDAALIESSTVAFLHRVFGS